MTSASAARKLDELETQIERPLPRPGPDIIIPFPSPPEAEDDFTCGPLPYQVDWLEEPAAVKLALWGVGSGKTAVGLFHLILVNLAWDGMRSLIVAPTFAMLEDTILPMLEEMDQLFQDLNGFKLIAKRKQTQLKFRLFNGSWLLFRSAERPHRLRGPTVGFVWLDETSTMSNEADVYEIALSRLRGRGPRQLIVTTTPMGDVGIVGSILEHSHRGVTGYHHSRKSTFDNPYLPADYIPRMARQYSREFYLQEVFAKVLKVSGLVYPDFDRDDHLISWDPWKELRTGRWTTMIGLDWGYSHAHAVWCAVRTNKSLALPEVVVFHEQGFDNQSDEQVIQGILGDFKRFPRLPRAICPDPESPEANKELRVCLRKAKTGIQTKIERNYHKRRIFRSVELVRRGLMTSEGEVSLKFAKRLLEDPLNDKGGMGVIASLEGYRRQRDRTGRGHIDKPHDDNRTTHSMDALRYVYLNLHRLGFKVMLPKRGILLPEAA